MKITNPVNRGEITINGILLGAIEEFEDGMVRLRYSRSCPGNMKRLQSDTPESVLSLPFKNEKSLRAAIRRKFGKGAKMKAKVSLKMKKEETGHTLSIDDNVVKVDGKEIGKFEKVKNYYIFKYTDPKFLNWFMGSVFNVTPLTGETRHYDLEQLQNLMAKLIRERLDGSVGVVRRRNPFRSDMGRFFDDFWEIW